MFNSCHEKEQAMPAKVTNTTSLYQGRVFRLDREELILPNGKAATLDLIRHPGAAAMVPVSSNNGLIMVKQYRHAVKDFIWEIPAGTLHLDETPMECAERELREETGYAAGQWERLGEITPVPGYSDERIHIFLATKLTRSHQELDPDEVINVHEIPLREAFHMIEKGRIQDSKTISALFLAKKRLPAY